MARTNVRLFETCLRRISKTETFLPSLRRLGPFAARRVAASSAPRPFLKLVSTGVDVKNIETTHLGSTFKWRAMDAASEV
jgi:hypothetical protein